MKNNLKVQSQRLPSADTKKPQKTVSVLKCFICNQMFYSQVSFDDHMSHHSSKISRNVPEEIQRKTMESFRIKKNIGVVGESIKDTSKNSMSTTAYRNNRGKMRMETAETKESVELVGKIQSKELEINKCENTENDNEDEMGEMEEALRESTILIEKIESLISEQDIPEGTETCLTFSATESGYCSPIKTQTEQEFLSKFLISGEVEIWMILSTRFSNCYLKGHQDQLLYLEEVSQQINKHQLFNQKINNIQSSILASLKQYLIQNTSNQYQIINKEESSKMEGKIVQNVELSYCNECFLEIGFEESYYELESNKYHCECWEQMENGHE